MEWEKMLEEYFAMLESFSGMALFEEAVRMEEEMAGWRRNGCGRLEMRRKGCGWAVGRGWKNLGGRYLAGGWIG